MPTSAANNNNDTLQGPPTLDSLKTFLPDAYTKGKKHTKSRGTRAPGFYDLHLHKDLRLDQVVYHSTMTKAFCDLYYKMLPKDLKSKTYQGFDFHSLYKRFAAPTMKGPTLRDINNEADLMDQYLNRTGVICTQLASAILRHQIGATNGGLEGPKDKSRFDIVMMWEGSNTTRNSGLGDLYLKRVPKDKEPTALIPIEEYAGKDSSIILESELDILERNNILSWAIIEGKSLLAGGQELMDAISRYGRGERSFEWMECGSTHFGQSAFMCGSSGTLQPGQRHLNATSQYTQTGRRTGPDSVFDFWRFQKKENAGKDSKSCKPKQPDDDDHAAWDKKAAYVIQQVWSELVQADCTFGIIHAGNLEIFVGRVRKSRTLYISEIIQPSSNLKTPHYILHTGFCVAAYLDASQRAWSLDWAFQNIENERKLSQLGWWEAYRRNYDYDAEAPSYRSINFAGGKSNEVSAKGAKEKRHQRISATVAACKKISVTLPASSDVKPTRAYRFSRHRECIPTRTTVANTARSPLDTIVPQAREPRHLSKDVWRAQITVNNDSSDMFVIKLAKTEGAREDLLRDYRGYFASDGSPHRQAPRSLGLFTAAFKSGSEWYIHITEYVGEDVSSTLEKKNLGDKKLDDLFEEARVKIEEVVDAYHEESGKVHRMLDGHHLLLKRDGATVEDVKLISFRKARDRSPNKAKAEIDTDKDWLRGARLVKK